MLTWVNPEQQVPAHHPIRLIKNNWTWDEPGFDRSSFSRDQAELESETQNGNSAWGIPGFKA
jgi:hypothetical protein